MAIDTQIITGRLSEPDGDPITTGSVRFTLSRYDATDNGVIAASRKVEAPLEADGSIALELWPNTLGLRGTSYVVELISERGYSVEVYGRIQIGEAGPYTLADLLRTDAPPAGNTFWSSLTEAEYNDKIAEMDAKAAEAAQSAADAEASADRVDLGALDAAITETGNNRTQTGLDRVATGQDKTAAAGSAALSQAWAEGTEPGGPGTKSAQEHAADAAGSETAAATSAAQAALYDGVWLDDVQTLIADETLSYGPGASGVSEGDYVRTRAEGFSYQVAASGATDHHLTTAGGVKLYVLPGADGAYSLAAFGANGFDGSDCRVEILAAVEVASSSYDRAGVKGVNPSLGARIVGEPGARYHFSGRIRIKSGVTLDLGHGASGATLVSTSTTGGIEQEGASTLCGGLAVDNASFTGPLLELNGAKTTTAFGQTERQTEFNVWLHGGRQPGSVGLLMQSNDATQGVARVWGKITVDELDHGVRMVSNGDGYVNSCRLEISAFDPVECLDMEVNDTGEIAANQINLVNQTGIDGRSGRVLRCDGQNNEIYLKSWDWTEAKIASGTDGVQVLFSEKSGGNHVTGGAPRPRDNRQPAVVDLAPTVRANFIAIDDTRYKAPSTRSVLPFSYLNKVALGDIHDELAFAYLRYRNSVVPGASVMGSGETPPSTTSIQRLFEPNAHQLSVNDATETIVTVDLGATRTGGDFSALAVAFNAETTKPDKCKVDFSTDGTNWTTQLSCGYDGEAMPHVLERVDGSGFSPFRYVRLTCENDTPRNLRVARLSLLGIGQSVTGGAFSPLYKPVFHGPLHLYTEFGGEGYFVDGVRVVTSQRPAIADATDAATTQARLNDLLAALRTHGLIAT